MEARVRGNILLGFGTATQRLFGAEAWRGVLARLDPSVSRSLKGGEVVTSGWYPMAWFVALHGALREQCGPGSAARLGRETSVQDVNMLFRFILRLLSPEAVIHQAPRIWGTMYQGIALVEESRAKGRITARIGSLANGNAQVWEDWSESLATFLELAGARNVKKAVLSGGGDRDQELRLELTWE